MRLMTPILELPQNYDNEQEPKLLWLTTSRIAGDENIWIF